MSTDLPNVIDRTAYQSQTIVGRNRTIETDSFQTGINNNMLVIGPSGAGKTRHVLKPNLLQMGSSFIVLDTKGTLCREMGTMLAGAGYTVECLDFANICEEPRPLPAGAAHVGYNPLSFIRRDSHGRPNQQDILSIAVALCPVENGKEPFWDRAAANLLAALIAYVMEELPREEQTFAALVELAEHLNDGATFRLLDDLEVSDPDSLASSMYLRYASTRDAEKMNASIIGIIAEKLMCLGFDGALRLYTASRQVDFARFGHERRALFVTMSDIDRALDPLTSLFVDQAFKALLARSGPLPGRPHARSRTALPRRLREPLHQQHRRPARRRTQSRDLGHAAAAVCESARGTLRPVARHVHHGQLRRAARVGLPGPRHGALLLRACGSDAEDPARAALRSRLALRTRSACRGS